MVVSSIQGLYATNSVSNIYSQIDTARVNSGNNKAIAIFNGDSISRANLPQVELSENIIKVGRTNDSEILKNAPSPKVSVRGQARNAVIVVDTKENILYKYDASGNIKKAYKVSTGRPTSPTHPGVYSIGWVEKSPYNTAPESTLRFRAPGIFGPAAVILHVVDEKTGAKKSTGIMIHGCYKDSDVGGNWSGGCVRMFNSDIMEIASDAKKQKGSYIKVM